MDDAQDALDMMTLVLESAGFHVASAMCASDALARLAAGHFDGVVTDFNLPDGTGRDLIDRAHPDIRRPENGRLTSLEGLARSNSLVLFLPP